MLEEKRTNGEEGAILLERLAELEHRQWVHWTLYMIGNLTVENMNRWVEQCATPYAALSEAERESDRNWARKVMGILEGEGWRCSGGRQVDG